MPGKKEKEQDRVNAKRKSRYAGNDPKKKMPPRVHKSHMQVMGKPTPFELPEDICKRLGHKEIVLAQSAEKKITVCARLCGLFKVSVTR